MEDKLRKEYGYDGKPKQWQLGFDSALKEIQNRYTPDGELRPEKEGELWKNNLTAL